MAVTWQPPDGPGTEEVVVTTNHEGWSSTCDALDHHGTVTALDRAVSGQLGEALAEDLAAGLARDGYALVRIDKAPEFLGRRED
ncbi:Pas70 [Actinoplanes phage phiAsp2]|jgi:hypothetical protein|uniref:Pas70 n=1 Tax=Actinoplanes phage phiAsp2 TaxID=279303 RepID=Q6J7W1_9CAUD|nr:Pas70 [Actinoplanes phage phiAsp2]AAT36818.1 Pas70 [Actinoplanes phage phiAsp2]